ncbi:hypothetical protein JHK82_025334 [Glycine max]|nr:hypothetical protein JHK82_025334 [Glycine max]
MRPKPYPTYPCLSNTESAKVSRQQLKEAIYASLFDINVPVVCAINQATLALYAAKRTFGIVVRSKTKHCAWFTFSQTRHYKNSFFFFFGQVIP